LVEKFGVRMKPEHKERRFLDEMEKMCVHSDSTVARFKYVFLKSSNEKKVEMLTRLGYYIAYREGCYLYDVSSELAIRLEKLGCLDQMTVRKILPQFFKDESRMHRKKDQSQVSV